MPVPPDGAGLRICLLGRFEVRQDGAVIIDRTWPRAKAKALLKVLALRPERAMHKEELYELLWPELTLAAAAANLRKTLHHIRSAFRTAGLDTPAQIDGEGLVRLDPAAEIDVDHFEADARRARLTSDSPIMYEGALALYGGDLLPDDIYEEWTIQPREELRHLRSTLLLELAQAYCRFGQPGHAIERLIGMLGEEPLNEAAHRALIEAYAQSGSQDRAIQQYDALRKLLRDELGTKPSALTEELVQEVKLGRLATVRSARSEEQPPIRYATTSDGVGIAYWSIGKGPVLVDTWSMPHSHIAREWEMPELRAWYTRLGRQHTLVRYDPRGCGLSAVDSTPRYALDEHVRDLEAVVDAAADKVVLFGFLHMGPAAIAYAALHPDRVSHLILSCTYARGRDFYLPEQVPAMRQIVDSDFDLYITMSAPAHIAYEGNDDLLRRWTSFLYRSTRQEIALAAIDAVLAIDATALLPQISVPTLIIQYRKVPWLSTENPKRLEASIPGARLMFFDGLSPVAPFSADPEAVARAIEAFIGASPSESATSGSMTSPMRPARHGPEVGVSHAS